LTSTRASELTGESTGSCSFHLRQLAKYGFLEPGEGGRGRERPWRAADVDTTWSPLPEDLEATAAADALGDELLRTALDALARYHRLRLGLPPEWSDAGLISTSLLFVTAEELDGVGREIVSIVRRYVDRLRDPDRRPEGARPVRLVSFAAPLVPDARDD
jgi:hypothetical protein